MPRAPTKPTPNSRALSMASCMALRATRRPDARSPPSTIAVAPFSCTTSNRRGDVEFAGADRGDQPGDPAHAAGVVALDGLVEVGAR